MFTNRGARLKSWRLKHYLDQQRQPQELIEHLPSQPLPFTLRAGNDATTTTLERRPLHGERRSGVGIRSRRRSICDSSTATAPALHAVKEFHLDPASYIFSVPRRRHREATQPIAASIVWGPAVGDISGASRGVKKAGGHAVPRRQGRAARRERHREAVDLRRRIPVRRRRRQLLHDRGAVDPARARSPSRRSRFRRRPARRMRRAISSPTRSSRTAPMRRSNSSPGRRTSTCSRAIDRDLARAIDFGMFTVIVVPLLRSLKWVQRLRRQLRLVDHHPDHSHQRDHVPAAAQERRVDAEDAGDSARGQSDPGSLLEAEGDRSRRSRR